MLKGLGFRPLLLLARGSADVDTGRWKASRLWRAVALVLLAGLLLSSLNSGAQTPAAPVNAGSALTSIASVIEAKLNSMSANTGAAKIGWELFGFFVVANLVYMLIRGFMSGSGLHGVLADAVPLGIAVGVTGLFLTGAVGQKIVESLNILGEAVTGQPMGSVAGLMVSAAASAMETVRNLWNIGPTTGASSTSGWAAAAEFLLGFPTVAMSILGTVVGVFLVVAALAIYLAHLVSSQIAVHIALALAPFFVPFLLLGPAKWMFEGWLKFLVGAVLLKIVGLILLQVTGEMMGAILDLSRQAAAAGVQGSDAAVFDITKYAAIVLLAGLSALLMASAPSLATGLVSGGGGGAGFKGWSDVASKSPSTKMLLGGMGSGGRPGPNGQVGNVLSGVTRLMPNVVKPASAAVGNGISGVGAGALSLGDRSRARGAVVNGERVIGRDLSKMSKTGQSVYLNRMEAANARMAKQEASGNFYGPPSPRYVVTKPVPSTTPRRQGPSK